MVYLSLMTAISMAAVVSAQVNPIVVASARFLGYRNSTNTEGLRDLGFMGNIGNTWMLSFGDAVGTRNHNTFDPTKPATDPNGPCGYTTARNGGGVALAGPLRYRDISVITQVGGCGDTPEMGPWCQMLAGEDSGQGLGITNVVEVNTTHGVIYTRPTKSGKDLSSAGAGLAVVQLQSNADPTCTRPFGKSTWSTSEPDWGQLSALDGRDGFTYVFANGYTNASHENHFAVLARAPKAEVFNRASYTYWNGTGFNAKPIHIDQLNDDSPQYLKGLSPVGQGSAWYSTYYKKFVYINNGIQFENRHVYAWTANKPQGPWSNRVILINDTQPEPPTGGDYGGFIMPKYFSSDGKTIYFSWTRAGYYEAVVELTFA